MSALPLDDFALEMLNHFLDSTIESLTELSTDSNFLQRFPQLCSDWQAEAQANQLQHLASTLEKIASQVKAVGSSAAVQKETCFKLIAYLQVLKTQPDSETLFAQEGLAAAEPTEQECTFLQCRRGEYRFLLPVSSVVEISQWKEMSPLPQPDPRVNGMIAFRGQATPVFHLDNTIDGKTFFVICEWESSFFALEVNATDDIFRLKNSDFQLSSEGTQTRFIARGEQILSLLDIEALVRL
jgi:chemotaxis signal transduction protein